jgi:hypothetical protein
VGCAHARGDEDGLLLGVLLGYFLEFPFVVVYVERQTRHVSAVARLLAPLSALYPNVLLRFCKH